jgi:hypothetical protein
MRYQYIITPKAAQEVRSFYKNVYKRYRHTYSYEDMFRNINQAVDDMYLIEQSLHRRKPTLSRWQGWHMATNGRWYYAYTIEGDTIVIQDACHAQNMY